MHTLIFAHLILVQLGVTATRSPLKRELDKVVCRIPGYDHANKGTVEDGIAYLRGHDPQEVDVCHQPGGGGCPSRVSCDKSAAIYVCNDDPDHDKTLGLSDVADRAQSILDTEGCVWHPSTSHVVQGQAFDDGGWNVIVGIKNGDSC
ncbi:hypothetical protein N8I77_002360 [Diaporthe amygdali]|uniref:SSCRP protein n=1 Tax=Phomopsis amygdali TaxID=1214568 RepID=A0AAD9WB94_PHOAM|nr:hypothetical protein N8I77_002360 [Diaporthe amygdali]